MENYTNKNVEIHIYADGRAAIFYGPRMHPDAFELMTKINTLLRKAEKNGIKFHATIDTQLSMPLNEQNAI